MAIGRVISLDSGVYKILGENNEEIFPLVKSTSYFLAY